MSDTSATSLIVNWQKLLLIFAVLGSMVALMLTGQVEWVDVSAPFGLIVGAALQNGIGGAKGHQPAPLVQPADPRRRATDTGPIVVTPVDHGLDVTTLDAQLTQLDLDPTTLAEVRRAEVEAERRAARAQAERDAV